MKHKRLSGIKLTKQDFNTFSSIFLYRVLIDIVYVSYIYPNFSYYGFKLNPNIFYITLSYLSFFLISLILRQLLNRGQIADITIALIILIYYIPYLSMWSLGNLDPLYFLFVTVYFILLVYLNLAISIDQLKIKQDTMRKVGISNLFIPMLIISGFTIAIVSGIYTGFRISFDLSYYYEYRAEAREYRMPEILRYLSSWSSVGLNIGLVYSLINSKKMLSLFILIATLLSFSYNGKKSVLFIMLLTITISFFYKKKHLKMIPAFFVGISALSLIEFIFRNNGAFIAKHFIRRMLYIPPFMGTLYYDFFSTHELDFFRSSFLRRLGFTSPYNNIPRYIGQVYFGDVGILEMNANTGLCGDAFANFGYWSLLFMPFIIVMTFKIIQFSSKTIDYRIQLVVSVSLAYSFVSGSYFTLLLTNGIIFMIFLLKSLNDKCLRIEVK